MSKAHADALLQSEQISILDHTSVGRHFAHLNQVMQSGLLADHFERRFGGPAALTLWQVTHHHLNPAIH